MNTFIRATEIWEPNSEKTKLTLAKGHYGPHKAFEAYSREVTFGYDEGLPGRAWAQKCPIILEELGGSCFKRTAMAEKIGLTTAVAMPIFSGEQLHAVVLFLCGGKEEHAGAIEVWSKLRQHRSEMVLKEGYYGSMEAFERRSRSIRVMFGQELPGTAWKTRMPHLIKDPGRSENFLRARQALRAGITSALALPTSKTEEDGCVLAFLSAEGSPIARRFEIWVPDETGEGLIFRDGHCDEGSDLKALYGLTRLAKETTLPWKVCKTGYPLLADGDDARSGDIHFDSMLALPILDDGFCKAVVLFYS